MDETTTAKKCGTCLIPFTLPHPLTLSILYSALSEGNRAAVNWMVFEVTRNMELVVLEELDSLRLPTPMLPNSTVSLSLPVERAKV